MKVFYKSTLTCCELEPGCIFRAIPDKAMLVFQREKNETEYELLLDGEIIDPETNTIVCKPDTELAIRQNGHTILYMVKPLVNSISDEFMLAYEQFSFEYGDKESNEINAVKSGQVKMYAVDQSSNVNDWTELFKILETSFYPFKSICDKPKSHLKAVNEVRPIETVKRIGYESIPYLAAHSEDWLARTASGLKPARLFSRVEEDDYQIYENRVVKTLIDLIIAFLRKTEKDLRAQYEQLHSIINGSVQVGSFGFDASFQRALSELLVSDEKGEESRSQVYELVEKLHKESLALLKKYRTLKKTRLYKYLKRSKPVTNPLNETNILLMDKHYKKIFSLWKEVQKATAKEVSQNVETLDFEFSYDDYLLYCKTICGYAAHVIGFEIVNDGDYYRPTDSISLKIVDKDGLIHCYLRDETKCTMKIDNGLEIPISAGQSYGPFTYDGYQLVWENDINDDDIEAFCNLLKGKSSNGKEAAERKKKYQSLKMTISDKHRAFPEAKHSHFVIWPAAVEIESENQSTFRRTAINLASRFIENENVDFFITALARCEEAEQKITDYAKMANDKIMFLPITMFDINSYRRIQNVLLRLIVSFENGKCPCCGGLMRKKGNILVCENCNQLNLIKTTCPDPKCKNSYYYISYDLSNEIIEKMASVPDEYFYQRDSLFQYKDIGPMAISEGKLRTICPCCGK